MTDEEIVSAPPEAFVTEGKPGHNEKQIIEWLKAQARERIEKRLNPLPAEAMELVNITVDEEKMKTQLASAVEQYSKGDMHS